MDNLSWRPGCRRQVNLAQAPGCWRCNGKAAETRRHAGPTPTPTFRRVPTLQADDRWIPDPNHQRRCSPLLLARCLFCQRVECLPSWHGLQLWQRQCTTFPRGGGGDLGGGWGSGRGVMRAKWRERGRPSSLATARHRACPGCGDGTPTCMSMPPCQPKCCHRHHQGPQPPPQPKWGGLAPT